MIEFMIGRPIVHITQHLLFGDAFFIIADIEEDCEFGLVLAVDWSARRRLLREKWPM
jgi:hypothetical protein